MGINILTKNKMTMKHSILLSTLAASASASYFSSLIFATDAAEDLGKITYYQCEDDLGIFSFNPEKSNTTPDIVKKGEHINIHIVGDHSEDMRIRNLKLEAKWSGKSMYKDDNPEDTLFLANNEYVHDLTLSLPS